MAKNLKLNIKNTQIAQAVNLKNIKEKLAHSKTSVEGKEVSEKDTADDSSKEEISELTKEEAPRIKARSKSVFSEAETKSKLVLPVEQHEENEATTSSAKKIRGKSKASKKEEGAISNLETSVQEELTIAPSEAAPVGREEKETPVAPTWVRQESTIKNETKSALQLEASYEKLGPTGRHVKDFLPSKKGKETIAPSSKGAFLEKEKKREETSVSALDKQSEEQSRTKAKPKQPESHPSVKEVGEVEVKRTSKFKEFKDLKISPKKVVERSFDARDRHGLRTGEEESSEWRKRRPKQAARIQEDLTIRPSKLSVRIPISIKDLAAEMKLKSAQLIAKLFLQGVVVTLNDFLEDETTIQLLGHEFGCEISIDSSEEERIRITDKTIGEEIAASDPSQLVLRAPIVAFMGHVDHGKTSLIDAIRQSNRVAGEAGAITQHMGAFCCHTPIGNITILDTPGHEAFSAMRARGANVTDIVVLVIAGDEGIRQQTLEAIQHAKAAGVTIVVAINKSDKPNFNADNVYRQLSENELLPEAWGGQTITVNCSAVTKQGIPELLEMLALQAEVLELKANPHTRARGTVLESEMHKGLGAVATVLVQNGTLQKGDALVFEQYWGRVKTMHNESGKELDQATPSTPVEITGLSGLPEAGQEFIVVKSEKEAREISEVRAQGIRHNLQKTRKVSLENMLQQTAAGAKKVLNVVLRADVQGSLEALKAALQKIESEKAQLEIIFAGVGEIAESDVQLAAASKALIVGFHTQVEGHADALMKQLDVQVRLHDIIYHAIDDVKEALAGTLDKIAQEVEKGKVQVKALFKSSQVGTIAGCQVSEGVVNRNHYIRVVRDGKVIGKATIASLKRVKEDVREVQKGVECGILLQGFTDIQEGDLLESYEIIYIKQSL